MRILGLSGFYHDSAAALVADGRVVAAAQEERFSRRKGDASFPQQAVRSCLACAGLETGDLDAVVFYDKPVVSFERLISSHLHCAPFGLRGFLRAIPLWIGGKLWVEDRIGRETGFRGNVLFVRHHQSHAASAFYPSPFESAAVVTLDGVGEWDTTTIGRGAGSRLDLLRSIRFPNSLGLLYSAFTQYCGFRVNSGEYKLMGLAPYGVPRYARAIQKELILFGEDGSYALNTRYFDFVGGLSMIRHRRFAELLGRPARALDTPPDEHAMDVAASIQQVIEEAVVRIAREARRLTRERHLVMAGGVALNCVANTKVIEQAGFDAVWVQPAAGDAGGALGAALYAAHALFGEQRSALTDAGHCLAFLGPEYSDEEAARTLNEMGAVFDHVSDSELFSSLARELARGRVVGWFQGRMEFGPRALGNRSILADPRRPEMRDDLNRRIKFRESFRPFAPAVPAEDASRWFALDEPSPHMLRVAAVRSGPGGGEEVQAGSKPRQGPLPAVTHVDGSARVQTVDKASNPRFHALLKAFGEVTGCPVLVNTSFNVRGEPMVSTPADAYRCFLGSGIDILVIGNLWLDKERQPTESERHLEEWKRNHGAD